MKKHTLLDVVGGIMMLLCFVAGIYLFVDGIKQPKEYNDFNEEVDLAEESTTDETMLAHLSNAAGVDLAEQQHFTVVGLIAELEAGTTTFDEAKDALGDMESVNHTNMTKDLEVFVGVLLLVVGIVLLLGMAGMFIRLRDLAKNM